MSGAVASSTTLAWLRLVRLPAVFTALADTTMGYLLADAGFARLGTWATLALATASLYSAGMVLNDCYDLQTDARERPERPLPAGEIDIHRAWRAGFVLLGVGILLAATVGVRSGIVALALALAIWIYNAVAKATLAGPFVMGACRALNILMAVAVATTFDPFAWGPPFTSWLVAGGIGVYVMGITWFALDEAVESQPAILMGGVVLMFVGVLMLIAVPLVEGFQAARVRMTTPYMWPLLLCLLTAPVWRLAISAIVRPRPVKVQRTVKQALLTLILLDAALALVFAGPMAAILVLFLLIPANLLSTLIPMT